ncbi:hypothetical protein JCM6882_003931 [Rhodosporidiobolus microsporus]
MSNKATWVQMVDYAIHSGNGEKISRQKVKSYITDNWHYDFSKDHNKEALSDALKKRVDSGHVEKVGGSFLFTQKGADHYDATYESDDAEEEEEQEGAASSSPKAAPAGTKKKK